MLVLAHRRRWGRAPWRRQFLKPGAAEDFLIDGIGHLGAGDGHLADEVRRRLGLGPAGCGQFFQPGVQQHVDAAQKETGHRRHPVQGPALGRPVLQAGDIGLGHLPVAGQAEEQGDVDVDALADELPDGRQALLGGRHLDEDIGAVQGLPQVAGLGDGAVGVVGQVGVDLQADEAVLAVQPVIERPEDVGGPLHVLHGQGLVDLLDGLARLGQGADSLVIVGAAGDGLLEDGGVGGDPLEAVCVDELFQFAGRRSSAGGYNPARWTGQRWSV